MRQTDIKQLVAYSSISHISVLVVGIFSNSIQGIEGGITLGLAHGFVSPALFILMGGVIYDRTHNRILANYKGLIIMPLFCIFLFLFVLGNSGTPLTVNFIGEFLALLGLFNLN